MPTTRGPFESRYCKNIPTSCCDYSVISLSEGKEICRVWKEEDCRELEFLLSNKEEMIKTIKDVYDFIISEYSCEESQALEGEIISKEAREILKKVSNLLAKLSEGVYNNVPEKKSWEDIKEEYKNKVGKEELTLEELLELSVKYEMTDKEKEQQKQSFIRGMMPTGDPKFD